MTDISIRLGELLESTCDTNATETCQDAIVEINALRAEIAQLRLTDAEREALGKACDLADYAGFHSTTRAVLRGLLERLGGKECTA